MIAVLSPAKTFADAPLVDLPATEPFFARDAARLARAAAKLTPPDLQRLMHISPTLAALNVERYGRFAKQDLTPAIAAFDGDVYRGFDAATLDRRALAFAGDHVRILSGLYGLLRPTDAIRRYRLEMGTRWAPAGGDLYGFWKRRIAARLAAELAAEGSGTILNLASKEYWQAVAPHVPRGVRVIDVDFRDDTPEGFRFNAFVAKKARGAMARHLCETRADDPEALSGFAYAGYAHVSTEGDTMRFVR